MKILNSVTGGKIRAALTIVIAVLTAVSAIVDKVDWNAAPSVILLAIVQAVAHYTKIGD